MDNNIELLKQLDLLIKNWWIKNQQIHTIIEQFKQNIHNEESFVSQDGLIYVPINPLIKEAKDLWWAEAVAFWYNVLGTIAVNFITQNTLALSLAWPVIEKIWFFLREYIKAVIEHKKNWTPIPQWFKNNISNGLKNLLVDISIHDTIYTFIMAYGISHHIFDAWLLSIFSFLIALPPAILVKYSGNELLYYLQKNYTKLYGFQRERYYEARFILNHHPDPKSVFESTANKFWLKNHNLSTYHDTYFDHLMPAFSDRNWTFKLREIQDKSTLKTFQNLEIAHTLAKKDYLAKNGIYNFFYSSKEKWKKDLSSNSLESILKKYPYRAIIKKPSKEIIFDREIFYDDELRITFDNIISPQNNQLKTVMELKVHKDTKYLMEAMQFMMSKWKVQLTTHWKKDLL